VQSLWLRNLLKTKLIRLGEFDVSSSSARRERAESRKRDRAVAAARSPRTADAIGPAPRAVGFKSGAIWPMAVIAKEMLLETDDFRPGEPKHRQLDGEADRLRRVAPTAPARGHLKSEKLGASRPSATCVDPGDREGEALG
jgi:hypothetical protein